jgi:hypothetical protein
MAGLAVRRAYERREVTKPPFARPTIPDSMER